MKKFILSVAILLPIMFSFTSCEPGEDDFNCYEIDYSYKFIDEYGDPYSVSEIAYDWNTPRGIKISIEEMKRFWKSEGFYDIKIKKTKTDHSFEECE
jgi:hypothetical protein